MDRELEQYNCGLHHSDSRVGRKDQKVKTVPPVVLAQAPVLAPPVDYVPVAKDAHLESDMSK